MEKRIIDGAGMPYTIELKRIRKAPVLEDVSVLLEPGSLYLIMGASGSGKTSLINLLAGLMVQDSGEYRCGGKEFSTLYPEASEFRRKEAGYIFQNPDLLSGYSVRENILSSVSFFKKRFPHREEWEKRAEELEDFLEIRSVSGRSPGRLSGGEQQRVSIARALLKEPYLLLCDEPTSALDSRMKTKVIELIQKVTKEKRTITVLATHDWELLKYADSAFYLTRGKLSEITYEKGNKNVVVVPSDVLHSGAGSVEYHSSRG